MTRAEILAIGNFLDVLNRISSHADEMTRGNIEQPAAAQIMMHLLAMSCGAAAEFLEAVPGELADDQNRRVIANFRAAEKSVQHFFDEFHNRVVSP